MHADAANMLIAAVWAGLVLGVSFVAQPAKFATPGLARPLALSAGRQMFRALHIAEGVAALCALTLYAVADRRPTWALLAAAAVLAIQISVLMPPLSRRVDARLAGAVLPKGPWHALFGLSELLKVALLLTAAIMPAARMALPS